MKATRAFIVLVAACGGAIPAAPAPAPPPDTFAIDGAASGRSIAHTLASPLTPTLSRKRERELKALMVLGILMATRISSSTPSRKVDAGSPTSMRRAKDLP